MRSFISTMWDVKMSDCPWCIDDSNVLSRLCGM